MGKSIRSKRKKRLRTLKREIVEPHYDVKQQAKLAVQAAALEAPKIELPKKREAEDAQPRGRPGAPASEPMAIDGGEMQNTVNPKLKATGGIRKRGKSRKRDLSSKRKKQVKF